MGDTNGGGKKPNPKDYKNIEEQLFNEALARVCKHCEKNNVVIFVTKDAGLVCPIDSVVMMPGDIV